MGLKMPTIKGCVALARLTNRACRSLADGDLCSGRMWNSLGAWAAAPGALALEYT